MQNKQFTLRYLPLFHQDLLKTALYITDILGNPDAAEKLKKLVLHSVGL